MCCTPSPNLWLLKCYLCSWKSPHFSHRIRIFNQSIPSLPSRSATGGGHRKVYHELFLILEFLQQPKYLSLISARYLVQVLYFEAYINPTKIRHIHNNQCFYQYSVLITIIKILNIEVQYINTIY